MSAFAESLFIPLLWWAVFAGLARGCRPLPETASAIISALGAWVAVGLWVILRGSGGDVLRIVLLVGAAATGVWLFKRVRPKTGQVGLVLVFWSFVMALLFSTATLCRP